MMKQSTYYGLTAAEVSKNEALPYFEIENMVHYLYEAGKEPVNNYIYSAFSLVKTVFSQDENEWKGAFRKWREDMHDGEKTIERIGVKLWPSIFRAFYFASPKWDEVEKKENYDKLIRLYFLTHEDEKLFFSQDLIEDLTSLWEGIPNINVYVLALRTLIKLDIKNNWNDYELFYRFLGQSLYVLYRLGYNAMGASEWKIQTLIEKTDNGENLLGITRKLLDEISGEVEQCIRVLENLNIRLEELENYRIIKHYLEYMRRVTSCESRGLVKDDFQIISNVHDVMAEKIRRLENIENEDEFLKAINQNEDIPIRTLVYLLGKRVKRHAQGG